MSLHERIKELLTEHGFPFYVNDKSIITTCPSCSKPKHFYMFKESGFGTCMRCGWQGGAVETCVMITGCSYRDAQSILKTTQPIKAGDKLIPRLGSFEATQSAKELEEIPLPFNFFTLEPKFTKAWNYVVNRGVSPEAIKTYDLRYCPDMQRVIIPIRMEGINYGYQGRDITGQSQIPYLSPPKMPRSSVLMGYDQIKCDYQPGGPKIPVIICEGPFDMLRIGSVFGGNVLCSMGKNISKDQLDLIDTLPMTIGIIIFALDPDAYDLLDKYASYVSGGGRKILVATPPDGRKDFGECTDSEISLAMANAAEWSVSSVISGSILKNT